jgi:cell division protein FtsN
MGVFAAFLWHLWDLRQQSGRPGAARATASASQENIPAPRPDDKPKKDEEPRFEFYTLLPSQEVIPGKPKPADPALPPAGKAGELAFMLQAGSFKSEAEADKRRASILMLGMPVKIVRIPGKAGETWYRVVVGPFAGKAAAQTARDNLRSNGVESLIIKQG